MVKGITDSGFEFEVNENVINDFTFLKAYRKIDSKNAYTQIDGFTDMIALLFGPQEEEYFKYLRARYAGIVPADQLGRDIGSILREVEKHSEESKK